MEGNPENFIKEGERLDDLQLGGLKIIQNSDKYCFTSDAVLLSSFARIKKGETALDFCSGSGVISVLASAKNPGVKKIYGIELQPSLADMAKRSVQLNGLENVIEILNMPVQEAHKTLGCGFADVIVCNPPYSKRREKMVSESPEIAVARHEISVKLSDIFEQAKRMLRFRGRLYIVHIAERAAEVICGMEDFGIQPKTLRTVQSRADKDPHLVLIEGVLGGGSGLKVQKPLYILDANNNYTEEAKKIYNIG